MAVCLANCIKLNLPLNTERSNTMLCVCMHMPKIIMWYKLVCSGSYMANFFACVYTCNNLYVLYVLCVKDLV